MVLPEKVLKWIVDTFDSNVLVQSNVRLKGSTSSILHRITLNVDDQLVNLCVRQFNNREWVKQEPDLALHEAESLRLAAKVEIETPELIAYREKGDKHNTPMALMTMLDGTVELKPKHLKKWVDGLANALAGIHKVNADHFKWEYFTYQNINNFKIPKWSNVPRLWKKAIEIAKGPVPEFVPCLIHRDYHPANVLWKNDEVSGVVDWVNACRGPAGIDVGHCRVNLAMLYDVSMADAFLTAYQESTHTVLNDQVYWDIISLIDILEGPPTVYPGWEAFGVTGLTDNMMEERLDKYLESLVTRL